MEEGGDEGSARFLPVTAPYASPVVARDWKTQIAAQLRFRDMQHGKQYKIVSQRQSSLLLTERELKAKVSSTEVELQKLRLMLDKDAAPAAEENPEIEAYKRQLADIREYQEGMIKNMEDEIRRWEAKCEELEMEGERLRIALKGKDEEMSKMQTSKPRTITPRVATPRPVALPRKLKPKYAVKLGQEITCIAFSPDGQYLSVGGRGKTVKILDSSTGQEKCTLSDPSMRSVLHVGFSSATPQTKSPSRSNSSRRNNGSTPNTELLIATSSDCAARLWNVEDIENSFGRRDATVNVKHVLRGHSGAVVTASFSNDVVKVVTGSYDRTIKLWDLAKGYCLRTLPATSACTSVCLVSEENLIFSGHADGKLYVWDPRTGESVHEFNLHTKRITSLAISPNFDRRNIMTVSQDNTVKIFDLRKLATNESSKPLHVIGSVIPKGIEGSGVIVVGGGDGGGSHNHRPFKVGADWSKGCWSPDGMYVACGSASPGLVFVWDLSTNRTEAVLPGTPAGDINCCAWYEDALASGSTGGDVILWQPED